MESSEVGTVLGFTADPWESAMAALRLTGPAGQAGLQVRQGNDREKIFPEMIPEAGVLVIQRDFPRYRDSYRQIIDLARSAGKPVIYETDDLLLEMPEGHLTKPNYVDALLPMIRAAVEADLVTTSSPELRDYFELLNPNSRLLPNYLNDRLWNFKQPQAQPAGAYPVIIGYMGGETHLADLEYIVPTLHKIRQHFEDKVIFKFWGGKPPDSLLNSHQVEWTPINQIDYSKFVQFFAEQKCHIFIAPLCENRFNRCKSAIKFLEYSTHGVPGVYSRIPAYENVVNHGTNGFLASTLDEWEKYLYQLIEEPSLRYQMGLRAQQDVKDFWLLSQHSHEWLEVYREAQTLAKRARANHNHPLDIFLRVTGQVDRRQVRMEEMIKYLTSRVRELEQSEDRSTHRLNQIQQSRSWRMTERFIRIRRRLIPNGSARERLMRKLHLLT